MTITVIGTGFVGVVTSAVFASFGNKVYGLDIDEKKIASLRSGEIPFFEPQLESLVQSQIAAERLHFTTNYESAISESEIVFVCVGTPATPEGTADLKYVLQTTERMAPLLQPKTVVAIKSTVPPGTHRVVQDILTAQSNVECAVASVPEYLREGHAVDDTLNPDRVVIGSEVTWATEKLLILHKPLGGARVIVKPESAQMAKYAANAYLAQRITFINQIANLCEKNGASVSQVIEAIGYDKRIGSHYWYPGLGYGGSCFPKDVKELAAYSRQVGEVDGLFVKLDELNTARIDKKMNQFAEAVGGFANKTIAVWGLSFKPNTNDMREAPSLKVIPWLLKAGATVRAYDPKAIVEAQQLLPQEVTYHQDAYEASTEADCCILLVEWDELQALDLSQMSNLMKGDKYLIDTRNVYNAQQATACGLKYLCVGNG